jgi:hypothetical protein
MWARVKGKTENTILLLPFKAAYMFRPAGIQPLDDRRNRPRDDPRGKARHFSADTGEFGHRRSREIAGLQQVDPGADTLARWTRSTVAAEPETTGGREVPDGWSATLPQFSGRRV